LITMIPEDIIEVKNGLTPSVLSQMPKLVEATLEELKKSGIVLKRRESVEVSFETVLHAYANPTAPRVG